MFLKRRRIELGLTLEEVGNYVGVGKSTVRKWENGDIQNLKRDKIASLSEILKINPLSIVYDDESINESPDIQKIYNKLNSDNQQKTYDYASDLLDIQNNQNKLIHLDDYIEETQNEGVQLALHGRLSAGTGTINYDRTNPEMIIYYGKVPKHDLCFIVKGDSMTPLFKDSEIIFIERTYDIRSGQVIAVSINGEEYVKKAYKEDHQLRLVSLNKKYEDITANEFDDIRVIGRVIL